MASRIQAYLTESEINDILRQPDRTKLKGKRDFVIMLLMLRTGLRVSEVCKLRLNDLRLENRKAWLYVIGKGNKERKIPIRDRQLIEALQKYWKSAGIKPMSSDHMFKTLAIHGPDKGGPISKYVIANIITRYSKMAKIAKNIHPHSLRHTFITHALRKSNDIVAVRRLAGHSNIATTQLYLHTEDELMEKAIDKMLID